MSTNFWKQNVCWQCPAMFCLYTFPAHNLNFHWRWRWWDQIQPIILIFITLWRGIAALQKNLMFVMWQLLWGEWNEKFNYFVILNNFVIYLHPLSFNVWIKNFRALWFNKKFADFEAPFFINSGCKIARVFFSRQILLISL